MDHVEVAARMRRYLDASSSGRWNEAAGYVADQARFVFPGGEFRSLAEMPDQAGFPPNPVASRR